MMQQAPGRISPLFLSEFEVDERLPFFRHLNRLEVEIGQEDYSDLKRVELLEEDPGAAYFARCVEITGRLLGQTQNRYNRDLLKRLGVRIYLDPESYEVCYRHDGRTIRFTPHWRRKVLQRFFRDIPAKATGWVPTPEALPGFAASFLPDSSGGVLLLRKLARTAAPEALFTSSHGPYDPHTLEVVLYLLRSGRGGGAIINLGFAGREPLSDGCLKDLNAWGIPLNPSSIDVIYPYLDCNGHPCCYKLEEHLACYVAELGRGEPVLILDIHGCVGTSTDDTRILVGLGGYPPYPEVERFGTLTDRGGVWQFSPGDRLRRGLQLVRDLSPEIFVQYSTLAGQCFNFAVMGRMQMLGREIVLKRDLGSLIEGEERSYLLQEGVRWLPGASANALQRSSAASFGNGCCVLHVEIPTVVRRKMVVKLRELEIESSLDAASL